MGGEQPDIDVIKDYNKNQLQNLFKSLNRQLVRENVKQDGYYWAFDSVSNISLYDSRGQQVQARAEINADYNEKTGKLGFYIWMRRESDNLELARYFVVFSRNEEKRNSFVNKTEPTIQVNLDHSGIGIGSAIFNAIDTYLLEEILNGYSDHVGDSNFTYTVTDGTSGKDVGWTTRRMREHGFRQVGEKIYEKLFSIQD